MCRHQGFHQHMKGRDVVTKALNNSAKDSRLKNWKPSDFGKIMLHDKLKGQLMFTTSLITRLCKMESGVESIPATDVPSSRA